MGFSKLKSYLKETAPGLVDEEQQKQDRLNEAKAYVNPLGNKMQSQASAADENLSKRMQYNELPPEEQVPSIQPKQVPSRMPSGAEPIENVGLDEQKQRAVNSGIPLESVQNYSPEQLERYIKLRQMLKNR